MKESKFWLSMAWISLIMSCSQQANNVAEDASVQQVGEYMLSLSTNQTEVPEAEFLEFKLQLQRNDGEDLVSFDGVKNLTQSRIYYYSYRMKEAIYLEQSGRKWPVDFCHFERSFDLKKGRNFMLAFDKRFIDQNSPYQVIIDSELLATGPVKFRITPNREN